MRGGCFLVVRSIVFGLFVVCNATICSVAAWNFGLVQNPKPLVDIYLIFLGAFSLSSIFALVFVELLCINPFTTRVWFECAWVALFWIMELAGGAALIAIGSGMPCRHQGITYVCASEWVLLAFTWLCTIMLLVYLIALVYIAASQHYEGTNIWASDVRTLHTAAVSQYSPTRQSLYPSTGVPFKERTSASGDIYTHHPVRSQPTQTWDRSHYRDLSAEFKVEPFRPVSVAPEQMEISYSSSLREAIPLLPVAGASIMPSSIPALPRDTVDARPRSSTVYASPRRSNSLYAPSLLGDWPRRDVMMQPVKPKRSSLPPSAFEFPKVRAAGVALTDRPMDAVAVTQPRPRRPSGPRPRTLSGETGPGRWLAPLDLTGISSLETGRQ